MSRDAGNTHPEDELRRIESGAAADSDYQAVARHLVRGCSLCGPRLAEFWSSATLDGDALAAAIERARRRLSSRIRTEERERAVADGLVARLADESDARRFLLIRNLEGARRRAVCERLIHESHAWRHESAAETLRFAELAVLVAERLGDATNEIRAGAYAELGNAKRIYGDLAGAENDLLLAQRLLDRGGTDPLVGARQLSFRASLARAQRRFDDSIELLLRAAKRYADYGDLSGLAGELIKLGLTHIYRGTPEKGYSPVTKALRILGPADLDLKMTGLTVLLNLLTETRVPLESAELARQIRPLVEARVPRLGRLRFDWTSARIVRALGEHELALSNLLRIRESFSTEGLRYDVALISFDLALTYARAGRLSGQLRSSVLEATALCDQMGLDSRQIARRYLFPHASEAEAADLRLALGIS